MLRDTLWSGHVVVSHEGMLLGPLFHGKFIISFLSWLPVYAAFIFSSSPLRPFILLFILFSLSGNSTHLLDYLILISMINDLGIFYAGDGNLLRLVH